MTYEVELKFPLDDAAPLAARLEGIGAKRGETIRQRDRYFAHPSRDFAQTDEALRVRSVGERNLVTYKGPLVDPKSKTRHEIEVPFATGSEAAEQLAAMLRALGFREVRTVQKRRVPYHVQWEDRPVELALDEVSGLGDFLEIETTADDAGREEARDSILRLADRLGLDGAIRKSYLAMLLDRDRD